MDPERPIEKLLRDYARKRREEFGSPPEVPATSRRALNEAVARQFRCNDRAPNFAARLFSGFWPRLAWSLATCAILAVAILALLPGIRTPSDRQEIALAKSRPSEPPIISESRPQPMQAQPPTPAAELNQPEPTLVVSTGNPLPAASDAVKAMPQAVRLQTELAQNATSTRAPLREEVAPAPALAVQNDSLPRKQESKLADSANPDANPTADERDASLKRYALVKPSPGHLTPATPPPNAYVTQKFMRVSATSDLAPTLKRARAQTQVLNSFQVLQNGSEVRILDGDGSVYMGSIQPPQSTEASPRRFDASAAAAGKLQVAERLPNNPAQVQSQAWQQGVYFFRVAGTNLTLKERVLFVGNMLGNATSNFAVQNSNALSGPGGAATTGVVQNAPTLLNFVPTPDSRVSGKLKVGSGKEVEINAIPAKP